MTEARWRASAASRSSRFWSTTGESLSDSTVILRYLEQLQPEPALFPRDEARRAELEVFLDWFNRVWKRPPNEIEAERGKPEPDQSRLDELGRELTGSLDVFEPLLAGRDYLFGEFSAADCAAFPFLKYGLIYDETDTEEFHLILREHLALGGRYPSRSVDPPRGRPSPRVPGGLRWLKRSSSSVPS